MIHFAEFVYVKKHKTRGRYGWSPLVLTGEHGCLTCGVHKVFEQIKPEPFFILF